MTELACLSCQDILFSCLLLSLSVALEIHTSLVVCILLASNIPLFGEHNFIHLLTHSSYFCVGGRVHVHVCAGAHMCLGV